MQTLLEILFWLAWVGLIPGLLSFAVGVATLIYDFDPGPLFLTFFSLLWCLICIIVIWKTW
jgi:hypothetical protein